MQANFRDNGDLELTADHIERDFIADVEAYLQKGGWLDFEAEHRGIRIQGIHVEPVPDDTGAGTA